MEQREEHQVDFQCGLQRSEEYRYVKHNPVHEAELPPEPVRPLTDVPTPEQLQSLIEALDEEEKIMVWLDSITGARPSELLGLRRRSIDFQRKCMLLNCPFVSQC